jgi:hypothetical protein
MASGLRSTSRQSYLAYSKSGLVFSLLSEAALEGGQQKQRQQA